MPRKNVAEKLAYQREYFKRRLAQDPDYHARHLARVRANNERYRAEVDELIRAFQAQGCLVCRESAAVCLCAHHLDGTTKKFNISDMRRQRVSPNTMRAELEKCVCLCMNCHAKLHADLIEIPKS